MERHEVLELQCITPIANVGSILGAGLLSHNAVATAGLDHADVSNQLIQAQALNEYLVGTTTGNVVPIAERRSA